MDFAVELRTRREALGLSQRDLAQILDVAQSAVSQWELGSRSPREPDSILGDLAQLADRFTDILDETVGNLEDAQAKLDSPSLRVTVYGSDETYWAADARAKTLQVPAVLHRHAVGIAVLLIETEDGATVEIYLK